MVRLVRANVPLGRQLKDDDYVIISWTLHSPEDDSYASSQERRHHVLARLLDEAQRQGAAPTDNDLADALNVSRRTILRDMETLATEGRVLPTRRRG
jgi:hypothetical protein